MASFCKTKSRPIGLLYCQLSELVTPRGLPLVPGQPASSRKKLLVPFFSHLLRTAASGAL